MHGVLDKVNETMSDDRVTEYDGDADLDGVEAADERLPPLEVGDYKLTLTDVIHVDGDSGVYDIFQVKVEESKGETANASGTAAKLSFKRDETNKMKKDIAAKKLANCLAALNGGAPESNSAYIRGLRAEPKGQFRVVVTSATAEKSGNAFKKYAFRAV